MRKQDIEIVINPKGEVTFEVKGLKGVAPDSTLVFRYDPRIHSRYCGDPNRFIDLGLPVANRVAIQHLEEVAPEEGFHSF